MFSSISAAGVQMTFMFSFIFGLFTIVMFFDQLSSILSNTTGRSLPHAGFALSHWFLVADKCLCLLAGLIPVGEVSGASFAFLIEMAVNAIIT